MFFPVVLILTCFFTLCNIYGKILNILGFTSFEYISNKKILEEGERILLQIEKYNLMIEKQNHEYDKINNSFSKLENKL